MNHAHRRCPRAAGLLCLLIGLVTLAAPARAHHSANANYDLTRTIELRGRVVEFRMRSPHSIVRLQVDDRSGKGSSIWTIETHALPTLRRAGWDKDTLKPGDVLSVKAFPNRRPNVKVVNAREFVRPDGTVLSGVARSAAKGATAPTAPQAAAPSAAGLGAIAGRWKPDLFPPADYDSRKSVLPLTEAGRKAWAAYDLRNSPAKKCIPNNIPDIFYPPYLYELRVRGNDVVLRHELFNVTRTVPLGAQARRVEPSGQFGTARARIERGVLIVETSGFPANPWGLGMAGTPLGGAGDVPSSSSKKAVERYSVDSAGQVLTVEYTIEDPVYLSRPYTARQTFRRMPDDTPIYRFDCDPNSARLYDQGAKPR